MRGTERIRSLKGQSYEKVGDSPIEPQGVFKFLWSALYFLWCFKVKIFINKTGPNVNRPWALRMSIWNPARSNAMCLIKLVNE
jgi:hypothetical protein